MPDRIKRLGITEAPEKADAALGSGGVAPPALTVRA